VTFSIVGRSPDGTTLGVGVASKFLAVGAYVPAAAVAAGALATQADVNLALRPRGIELLADGVDAGEMLSRFFAEDPHREERQAGAVDARGGAATYTGSRCLDWAGGRTGEGPAGSFAVQGNILTGPEVVEEMVASWLRTANEPSMARRLLAALEVGDAAGGDRRGRQSAAILVVAAGAGYGGVTDVAVDLRCDDAAAPIPELARLLGLHELYFGSTPEDQLLDLDEALSAEVTRRLGTLGYADGALGENLYDWMGRENFEARWHEGRLDPVVLAHLRSVTAQ
jgi:uncharacterized Ntn-hydrolase superfamily protein